MFDERRSFEPRGPRTMYKATCAECNKECDVPFEPKKDRPVYCRDCWSKKRKPF